MKRLTVKDLTAEEKLRLICGKGFWNTEDLGGKLPSVAVSDGPLGLRKVVKDETGREYDKPSLAYPSAQSLANTWSRECAGKMGECLADDCLENGVDILLAPGVNIKRHPLNGRNFEYLSEDPYLAGTMAKAYIDGLQGGGVGACLKHFCCNNLEYNRFEQSSEVDERTLREIYYKPFAIACEAKPVSVMSAYNRVNGVYAAENKKGIRVLREELGFDGAIFSDWDSVRNRTKSAQAGVDIEMPYCEENYRKLVEDYNAGRLSDEALDDCAGRVLKLVYDCAALGAGRKAKRTQEARWEAARGIAEESMVLLKNEGILPLQKGTEVSVSGCYAVPERRMVQGDGSSAVTWLRDGFHLPKLLEERLGKPVAYECSFYYGGVVGHGQFSCKPARGYRNAALSDVNIICVGTGAPYEYESVDRTNMRLPEAQERAILNQAAVNPNTVVVIFAGSAIDVSAWEAAVKGILFAGFCGETGGQALADILCGIVTPSGKLSETFPIQLEDSPAVHTFTDGMVTRYQEGLDVGYRYYDTYEKAVRYPFGYGLSYASFVYSGLRLTQEEGLCALAEFTVENRSDVDGKETAQLYVQPVAPAVYRPRKELKGYEKKMIPAGQSVRMAIPIEASAFAYWSCAEDRWVVDDGLYRILIGADSRDLRLSLLVRIQDGKLTAAEKENGKS